MCKKRARGRWLSRKHLRELQAGEELPAKPFALYEDLELVAHADQQGVELAQIDLAREIGGGIGFCGLTLELLQAAVEAETLQKARLAGEAAMFEAALAAPVIEG